MIRRALLCATILVGVGHAPAAEPQLVDGRAQAGIQTVDFADTGLPSQITLRAHRRELPLELRDGDPPPDSHLLQWLGRGPRLAAPIRIQAWHRDEWIDATAATAATPTLIDGHVTCRSTLTAGPYTVTLTCRYAADGALHLALDARGGTPDDRLSLMVEPRGPVDLAVPALGDEPVGAIPPERLDPTLENEAGVVWDSAERIPDGIRQLYVGSADAGFSWFGTDLPALADGESRTTLTRDQALRLQWRTLLLTGAGGSASMTLRAHPLRHRPADARAQAWLAWPDDLVALPGASTGPVLLRSGEMDGVDADAPGYPVQAAAATHAELRGAAAAAMLSRQHDAVALYPIAFLRALAGGPTALTVRLRPNVRALIDAYEPGLDRQVLGRALLHDIGVDIRGLGQGAEFLRVVAALRAFGYFADDGRTEFIPYWRTDGLVRYGEAFDSSDSFNLTSDDPATGTHVSVYRRPYTVDGHEGVQVLFVVVNERDQGVRHRLSVLDVERIFGRGRARPRGTQILADLDYGRVPAASDWGVDAVTGRAVYREPGLRDLETHGFVRAADNKGQEAEIYGPLHIAARDVRLVWAFSLPKGYRR